MAGNPYSRIYWSILDDPKFDTIRDDVRLLGSWVVLLLMADLAYPAPAYRPPIVTPSAMRALVACGLVDELPAHRYKIHGLASERGMRSHHASNAAASRWGVPSNSKAKHKQAEGMRSHNSVEKDPLLREIKASYLAKGGSGDESA